MFFEVCFFEFKDSLCKMHQFTHFSKGNLLSHSTSLLDTLNIFDIPFSKFLSPFPRAFGSFL